MVLRLDTVGAWSSGRSGRIRRWLRSLISYTLRKDGDTCAAVAGKLAARHVCAGEGRRSVYSGGERFCSKIEFSVVSNDPRSAGRAARVSRRDQSSQRIFIIVHQGFLFFVKGFNNTCQYHKRIIDITEYSNCNWKICVCIRIFRALLGVKVVQL